MLTLESFLLVLELVFIVGQNTQVPSFIYTAFYTSSYNTFVINAYVYSFLLLMDSLLIFVECEL